MCPDAPTDPCPPSFERYDSAGRRLSMTAEEMRALVAAARDAPDTWRTLCCVLAFTGCRPAEALALTAADVDLARRSLDFRTIGRRKETGAVRTLPIPDFLLVDLARVHRIRAAQAVADRGRESPLWPWSHVTAWNRIGRLIDVAGIEAGPHTNFRGMRHGFSTLAIACGIPLSLIQKWLGHASVSATRRLYAHKGRRRRPAHAIGRVKERELASRVWAALTSNIET